MGRTNEAAANFMMFHGSPRKTVCSISESSVAKSTSSRQGQTVTEKIQFAKRKCLIDCDQIFESLGVEFGQFSSCQGRRMPLFCFRRGLAAISLCIFSTLYGLKLSAALPLVHNRCALP